MLVASAKDDAEIERKSNILTYALQLAEFGDYSLLKEVVPNVSEDELKRRVQMVLYGY